MKGTELFIYVVILAAILLLIYKYRKTDRKD